MAVIRRLAVHGVHKAAAHALGKSVHMVGLFAISRVHGVGAPHGCCALQTTSIEVAVGAAERVTRKAHGVCGCARENRFTTAHPLAHRAFGVVCCARRRELAGLGNNGHSLGIACCRCRDLGWLISLFGSTDAHAVPQSAAQTRKHASDDRVFSQIGRLGLVLLCFGHIHLRAWQALVQHRGYADAGSRQPRP